MPLDNPLDYLQNLTLHGVKLGLANIRAMMKAAGNPQDTYPSIHIAGTNGKGSTLAFLAAIFRAAGYRTGTFTSPHLIHLNERFQINGRPILDHTLHHEIRYFQQIADTRDHPPTFFELNTAVAFHWFARERVDAAIIETGLGGRLDSTNILHPIATAITNIDLEHTQYLGDTLEEIAYEKAGIIKKNVPTVLGETKPGPAAVLLARARHEHAPTSVIHRDFFFTLSGPPRAQCIHYQSANLVLEDAPLSLHGHYQGANAALAIQLAELAAVHFPRIDATTIREGLAKAIWPCRMEQVLTEPPIYIDVAHNPAGARQLAPLFERCTILLGVSSDKDAPGIVRELAPIAARFICTEYDGPRALSCAQLAAHTAAEAPGIPVESTASLLEALRSALPHATPEAPLLITGSIYLAGEARQALIEHFGAPGLRF